MRGITADASHVDLEFQEGFNGTLETFKFPHVRLR
jgi:hypothetical protein